MTPTDRERLIQAITHPTPAQVRRAERQTLRWNLPLRTRIRLAIHRRITRAGIWLCDHGHPGAAEWLWRACGMW